MASKIWGTSIPAVANQIELISEIQKDQWWVNVNYPILEDVRKRLRAIVHLVERRKKQPLYSDFADEIGEGEEVVLPGTGDGSSIEFQQFRKKAEHFLKENLGEATIAKVRSGKPLNDSDIGDLQRLLVAAGIGQRRNVQRSEPTRWESWCICSRPSWSRPQRSKKGLR